MKSKARSMWVWHAEDLLLKRQEWKDFFNFCKRKNIQELFFQLILSYRRLDTQEPICIIQYQDQMWQFLKQAGSRGLKLHALDGHPSFALKENHPKVLAIVQAVINFNMISSLEEKFYGVHFDIEPYLLPIFQSRERKRILAEFLELNKKCADLIHSKGDGLVYGIDIPFWFKESIGFDLIDICDNVGIMDYRNFAGGPDGIIEHGLEELKYADNKRKDVYIGVETSELKDEDKEEICLVCATEEVRLSKISFAGMSEQQFENVLAEAEKAFSKYSSFRGFAIHHYKSYHKLCVRGRFSLS